MREGKHTEADAAALQATAAKLARTTPNLCYSNAKKDTHNAVLASNTLGNVTNIAIDAIETVGIPVEKHSQILDTFKRKKLQMCMACCMNYACLAPTFSAGVTSNLDKADGITNGACGRVMLIESPAASSGCSSRMHALAHRQGMPILPSIQIRWGRGGLR